VVIGFLDETSPQTTANTQRFWSSGHPKLIKNTTKFRANTFGFYSINGCSVLEFHEHSKKEDVCEFLQSIRNMNPDVNGGIKIPKCGGIKVYTLPHKNIEIIPAASE